MRTIQTRNQQVISCGKCHRPTVSWQVWLTEFTWLRRSSTHNTGDPFFALSQAPTFARKTTFSDLTSNFKHSLHLCWKRFEGRNLFCSLQKSAEITTEFSTTFHIAKEELLPKLKGYIELLNNNRVQVKGTFSNNKLCTAHTSYHWKRQEKR